MLSATLPSLNAGFVLPGDPSWDHARSAFNLTLDQHPAAVALPADARDVAAAVAYARAAGLRVAPQGAAHNQGPLGNLEGTLLLNTSALQEVNVDPAARRVRVGAGVKWERVLGRLNAYGLAALHGSSPDVGVAGYSLGGGIGWLSRKFGLQSNAVTALELVTADGTLIRTDAEHDPDLFWALRGGGGSFGVVTAIEFEVQPLDRLYAGAMFFELDRAGDMLHTWHELLPEFPEELMSWASVIHFPPAPFVPEFARGRSLAIIMAAHLGAEAEGRDLLAPLRALGPVRDTFAMVPPIVLSDLAMDPLDPLPFRLTSALVDTLPVDELMTTIETAGPALTVAQFRHMGGAIARETPGAGARATLPGEICAMGLGVVMDEDGDAAVRGALAEFDAHLRPHRAGDYANFVEVPVDASAFFTPDVWTRLRAVKATYDPTDLFKGNHHVPPA
ncbi:FAD-binding oxidoreductase [Solirubrobacter sp. CPCC 204708]|uniref:FAD-binding oxidoreductase n=1 Tax=Solirubrobacter deserti TaxID=2282478 RepID=A0ABT4RCM1_9ACTN|nr:FAD-binding oxidoreductase [Solirubrobacter deserti]MBE2315647.1 FAD-binding oxidoreductase [Solirubrobacter deserti]MDA0136287.1 FAD-binding oxidoreductase [Solirubrobacter deserti]